MNTEILNKELADKLMKIEGEARGEAIKSGWNFVKDRKKEEGIREMEKIFAELEYPFYYNEIKGLIFYPIAYDTLSILAIKQIFNFSDEQMIEVGREAVQYSFILKIFMKYFGSLNLIAEQIPKIWRKNYTIGDLSMPDFSKEKRFVVVRLKNFNVHPVYCLDLGGFFSRVAELGENKKATFVERKCSFKGDEYHEYLITW